MEIEAQNPSAAAQAGTNGGAQHQDEDDAVVEVLRQRIAQRQARVDELHAELAEINPELKRYEKALALLTGEGSTPGPKKGGKKREAASRVGEERLAPIRAAVLEYARDHEEFRQVDIRTHMEGRVTSAVMAPAFEQLRQEGMIRLARQDGLSKWFRLTREAMRDLK
jgi:hypothetical protein